MQALNTKGYPVWQEHDIPSHLEYKQPAHFITIITESQRAINAFGDIETHHANKILGSGWQRLGDNIRCKLLYFTDAVPSVPLPQGFTMYGAWLCMDINQKVGNVAFSFREYEELRERLNNNLLAWAESL